MEEGPLRKQGAFEFGRQRKQEKEKT